MIAGARFAHTNLIARDARRLIGFYRDVFGCRPLPPERRLSGRWLDKGTGVANAEIRGEHLRLPGHGEDGPTLEIFQYARLAQRSPAAPNAPGYGHIAFAVPDVAAALDALLAAGGQRHGEIVTTEMPGLGRLTFVYAADPEGNLVELQSWQ